MKGARNGRERSVADWPDFRFRYLSGKDLDLPVSERPDGGCEDLLPGCQQNPGREGDQEEQRQDEDAGNDPG